jgi:hypothetical protein
MSLYSFRIFFILFSIICIAYVSVAAQIPNPMNPFLKMIQWKELNVIKAKLYQGDSILLVWIDNNGDNQCDMAIIFKKNDDSYMAKQLICKQADNTDKFILEPRL